MLLYEGGKSTNVFLAEAGNSGSERLGSDLNFTVCHSIGNITYEATNFIAKNKDQLRAEFVELLNVSSNPGKAASIRSNFAKLCES